MHRLAPVRGRVDRVAPERRRVDRLGSLARRHRHTHRHSHSHTRIRRRASGGRTPAGRASGGRSVRRRAWGGRSVRRTAWGGRSVRRRASGGPTGRSPTTAPPGGAGRRSRRHRIRSRTRSRRGRRTRSWVGRRSPRRRRWATVPGVGDVEEAAELADLTSSVGVDPRLAGVGLHLVGDPDRLFGPVGQQLPGPDYKPAAAGRSPEDHPLGPRAAVVGIEDGPAVRPAVPSPSPFPFPFPFPPWPTSPSWPASSPLATVGASSSTPVLVHDLPISSLTRPRAFGGPP